MKLFRNGLFCLCILPVLATLLCAIAYHCFYYEATPVASARIIADKLVGKYRQTFDRDAAANAIAHYLVSNGLGELRAVPTLSVFRLEKVTSARKSIDGTPCFNAYYDGPGRGVQLQAYFIGAKLNLAGLCGDTIAGCRFVRSNQHQPETAETRAVTKLQQRKAQAEALRTVTPAELLAGAGWPIPEFVPIIRNAPWVFRPDFSPVAAIGTAPAAKESGPEPPVLVNRPPTQPNAVPRFGTPEKSRPADAEAAPTTPLEATGPARRWLGKWSGDGLTFRIHQNGGRYFMGKMEAKMEAGELSCLTENRFGTPIWVKLSLGKDRIKARMESLYGEPLGVAVLLKK